MTDKKADYTMSFDTLTVDQMWDAVVKGCKGKWTTEVEFILGIFGTALSCNRFPIGESIEYGTTEYLRRIGVDARWLPSATRVDLCLHNVTGLSGISSKFCSTNKEVTLHNSQRTTATDKTLHPTFLFLVDEWWFLYPPTIKSLGINPDDYIKNTKDSIHLKLSILKKLKELKYPYYFVHKIKYDKGTCPQKATSELFYQLVKDYLDPETLPANKAYIQTKLDALITRRVTVSDYSAPANYASYTAKLLKEICEKRGLKLGKIKNKDDLVALLLEDDKTRVVATAAAAVTENVLTLVRHTNSV